MKPMYFDFAAKPTYRKVWAFFVIAAVGVLAVSGSQMHQFAQQKQVAADQLKQTKIKIDSLQINIPEPKQAQHSLAFGRQASQTAQLLKTDLNKAFTALESLKILGVRLQSVTLNISQNIVEVEFEFSQFSQSSDISEALMAGYSTSPWQLMSTSPQIRSGPQGAPAVVSLTGRWQAKLDKL